MLLLFYLSSGLFLGWSLGANDASNIFGTAVGSRMLRFKTAAIVGSIFVVLGAVISGKGTTNTLNQLGAVNQLAGSFTVALAAGFTVFWMTRLRLPVSTSQAIVGAIIGWNLFAGKPSDLNALVKITTTWVASPILAALVSMGLYKLFSALSRVFKVHLFALDAYTRLGLLIAGAFGAYSLGANNIANVMGVFVPVSPFTSITISSGLEISGSQQLFFLGSLAIGVGMLTYSQRVIATVGEGVLKLTPQAALVVVLSEGLVLFLFASHGLKQWLMAHHLPSFPLVPLSSSQVVVGAVVGIGLVHGGRNIRYRLLGKIASGWVTTPIMALLISFLALFFLQNVFNQPVYQP